MGSVVLIFLVFSVVVFGGFRGAHLFSFLCCSIWWGPCGAHIFSFLCCGICCWVRIAHLFSLLCCGIWWGPWCSSFSFSVLWYLVGGPWC